MQLQTRRHSEPLWRVHDQLFSTVIPSAIQSWLFDPGSLTARLVAKCAGCFRVEVLEQRWCRAGSSEVQRLEMRHEAVAFIREVYLYCDDIPWVFARTVIPRTSLSGPQKYLARLGRRPLGAVLFADPQMRRDPVEVAQLSRQHALYHKAVARLSAQSEAIWGRRSVFYLAGKPLLVNEFFLPTLEI